MEAEDNSGQCLLLPGYVLPFPRLPLRKLRRRIPDAMHPSLIYFRPRLGDEFSLL